MMISDNLRFAERLATSRWFVLVAAIWIQSCAGASYSFGIYSQSIKTAFGYDQKNLDLVASFKDLGANVGVVSGLVFDYSCPLGVLAIGAVESGVGYFMLWLSVIGKTADPKLWQTCLYMFLAANGQTFFNTGCVVTCVQNFPLSRGMVIGLLKGFLGLSGAILTQVYYGIYGKDPSSYLLLVSWLPSCITLILMGTVRQVPSALEERNENENLYIVSIMSVSLAAFLMTIIVLDSITSISYASHVCVCILLCGILLMPFGVVFKSVVQESGANSFLSVREQHIVENGIERQSGFVSLGASTAGHEILLGRCYQDCCCPGRDKASTSISARNKKSDLGSPNDDTFPLLTNLSDQPIQRSPRLGEDHSILEAMKTADFWLLFIAMGCGMGSALTAIDNTGQVGASLGYEANEVATFISLFSIWNFAGRLGFGGLSEICLQRYKMGRPVLLAISQGVMCLGHLLMCTEKLQIGPLRIGSLYYSSIVIGLCYGAQWSLMPAITSELFGLRRFATLFNIVSIASPLGAYFLSVQVAGRIYDAEAEMEHRTVIRISELNDIEDDLCHGPQCFMVTSIVLAGVSLFGCLVCFRIAARTRQFYARMF